jgi:hypothetical protein
MYLLREVAEQCPVREVQHIEEGQKEEEQERRARNAFVIA